MLLFMLLLESLIVLVNVFVLYKVVWGLWYIFSCLVLKIRFVVVRFEKLNLLMIKFIEGLIGLVNWLCFLILWICMKWLWDVLVVKFMFGILFSILLIWFGCLLWRCFWFKMVVLVFNWLSVVWWKLLDMMMCLIFDGVLFEVLFILVCCV